MKNKIARLEKILGCGNEALFEMYKDGKLDINTYLDLVEFVAIIDAEIKKGE